MKDSKQLVELTNAIKENNKKSNKVQMFLSIDEEGGFASSFPSAIFRSPFNAEIGMFKDPKLAYTLGKPSGIKLSRVMGLM